MSKRKTHEEFLSEINSVNSNIKILGLYKSANEKILCNCKICGHEWLATPHNLLHGKGCKKCSDKANAILRNKTHEQFVREMELINPNIDIIGTYIGAKTKVLVKCKIDNCEWYTYPTSLLQGVGCPECKKYTLSKLNCKSHDQFIKEVRQVNKDIEIISRYCNCAIKIKCRCKLCKHEWYTLPSSPISGVGCPNCRKSKGEEKIEKFLISNNIKYIPQYKFDDLIGVGNRQLSYDFYLDSNILIEYQGIQHYEPVECFGGDVQFEIQQEHDKRKCEYAKTHNITLIEIPYWDFDNIETILESRLLKQSA